MSENHLRIGRLDIALMPAADLIIIRMSRDLAAECVLIRR